MKCAIVSVSGPIRGQEINMLDVTEVEVYAFEALNEAKDKLKGDYAAGQENVMDPLHRFDFYEEKHIRYFCHLYSFIHGETLKEYLKKQTVTQSFITVAEVLPKIIKGAIYLYNAGIIHNDMFPKNIMLQLDSNRRIVGVKIIDLDATIIYRKEQNWQPINLLDDRNLLPNPPQKYESCHRLKCSIPFFLGTFVHLKKEELLNHKHKLTEPYALKLLKKYNQLRAIPGGSEQTQAQTKPEQSDVKAAVPAMLFLTQAHRTMYQDNFHCSSLILALKGLPSRVDTTSKSGTSWFKLSCF
ncbi:hypothetical protein BDF22DRAFT_732425 [Syncephalis plumigaleata]|nr:hypothetical protein BDF22DRAFT_732425 [Syncephalis plumigaleata]